MTKAKRILLIVGGTLSVALGVVGMFLPVLPTTPFLLLGAFCYARSSKRFYLWLTTNRWCGAYIRNYREGHGVSRQHKTLTILLLWTTIGCTAGLVVALWWVKLLLLGIAVAVTVHILKTKTFRPTTTIPKLPAGQESPEGLAMVQEATDKSKVMTNSGRRHLIGIIVGPLKNVRKRIQLRQATPIFEADPDCGAGVAGDSSWMSGRLNAWPGCPGKSGSRR